MKSKDALEILKAIVGDEKFMELSDRLSGMTVYFPSNYEYQNKTERNLSLRQDFFSGNYEISDLAKKYKLSISTVYKIIQNRE